MAKGERWLALGAAAALLGSAQLAGAQVANRNTAGTAPTDQTQTGTKVTPEQVIKTLDALSKLVKKKPAPTATPSPTQAPAPAPTTAPSSPSTVTGAAPQPAATVTTAPPKPAPKATSAPQPRPAQTQAPPKPPAPVPTPAPTADPAPAPTMPTETAAPTPPAIVVTPPAPLPYPPSPTSPPWALVAALLAAVAAGGTALYRWFWPKLALSCAIEVGPGSLGPVSSPLVSAPEARFDLRIEVGEAGPPRGTAILGEPL